MKKKTIITICSLVLVLGLVLTLCFTLFSLKTIQIDWRTSHSEISATDEEIILESGIKKGGSVLFKGKKKAVKQIEEMHPYIDVVNIETVFPSTFVIHLAQRQEVYAIAFEDGHYICDQNLRVLKVEENFENTTSSPILLTLENQPAKDVKVGEYLQDVLVPPLYDAFFENNRTLGEQTELIKSVSLTTERNTATGKDEKVFTLALYSGQTVRIVNADRGLTAKVKLMLDVYSQLFTYIGKPLSTPEGEVLLTEAILRTCTIEICSYLSPSRGENECYFDIFI
ncbi:MAG: FtsQ-type POTRA domain-containing protein [Clostridia bacterium]|nr:FtsQ-type POTRA domain-containing protein [Clostridia bacterium]